MTDPDAALAAIRARQHRDAHEHVDDLIVRGRWRSARSDCGTLLARHDADQQRIKELEQALVDQGLQVMIGETAKRDRDAAEQRIVELKHEWESACSRERSTFAELLERRQRIAELEQTLVDQGLHVSIGEATSRRRSRHVD